MILGRLFKRMFELGVVVVATSNVQPDELYEGGLNRALFLPFIALIEQHMTVTRLEARTDFRLEKLAGPAGLARAGRRRRPTLRSTTPGGSSPAGIRGAPRDLTVKGRIVRVPCAAMGVARFSFHDLCEQPLAASDYLRVAHEFHSIVLDRIPVMDFSKRNEAKRFIILIDTLYDHAVKLVASAAAEPDQLYLADEGYEAQEFKRTASRLIEMRSESLSGAAARPPQLARDAGGRHRGDVGRIRAEKLLRLQPRCLDDRRPALGLHRDEFSELLGVLIIGWKRSFLNVACTSSERSAALISALSLLTIGAGVPSGATIACHTSGSKPTSGKPLSLKVGTSGSSGSRDALVTASARTLPSWIIGSAFDTGAKLMWMRPPRRSTRTCSPPL